MAIFTCARLLWRQTTLPGLCRPGISRAGFVGSQAPIPGLIHWWTVRDSNPRPPRCESFGTLNYGRPGTYGQAPRPVAEPPNQEEWDMQSDASFEFRFDQPNRFPEGRSMVLKPRLGGAPKHLLKAVTNLLRWIKHQESLNQSAAYGSQGREVTEKLIGSWQGIANQDYVLSFR